MDRLLYVYINHVLVYILVWIIGASLSRPHTSEIALQDACVCMSACGHILKILIERMETKVHVHFKFVHVLKLFEIHVQCKLTWWTSHYLTPRQWMRQRTPHCVTQRQWIYWVRETDRVWRDRWCVCKHERRAVKQPVGRQAWNDAEQQSRLSLVL